MKKILEGVATVGFIALLVLLLAALFCLYPMIALWGVNTLSDLGGSEFYVPHGFWSYLAVFAVAAPFFVSRKSE
jgi:hypothetical protein